MTFNIQLDFHIYTVEITPPKDLPFHLFVKLFSKQGLGLPVFAVFSCNFQIYMYI